MDLNDILKVYAYEKMQNNGLLLLPMPTGSGKTYTVFKFIHDAITEKRKDKIIFITSLKKNIDLEGLKDHFKGDEELRLFDENVLLIKSFLECVVDNLLKVSDSINKSVRYSNEYNKLAQSIKFINENSKCNDPNVKEIVEDYRNKIKDTQEPNFRKLVKKYLNDEFKKGKIYTYKRKIDYIKRYWSWVIEVYPQILTKEKKVYMMSMDKFLLRNDPIIEKSSYIFKDLAKDAIIFIDEFDSTKDKILNSLVNDAIKSQINCIDAYKQIYHNLKSENLPVEMTVASQQQLKTKYGKDGLNDIIMKCQKRCNDIYEKYGMHLDFKLEENVDDDSYKTFLFHDFRHIIISGKKQNAKIVYEKDNSKRQNIIRFGDTSDELSKDFRYMLNDIKGFLKYFSGCVQILAINYLQCKQENENEDYTLEDAIMSFLDIFIDDDNVRKYFANEIMLYRKNEKERKNNVLDASFFDKGFSYYSIEDDDGHSFSSSVRITELASSPEKILLDICENAKVFGISATAQISTCIGNYALEDYLMPKLKDKFFNFTNEEFEVLKNHFEKSINHYDRVNVIVEEIKCSGYKDVVWSSIFTSDVDADEIFDEISQVYDNDNKGFKTIRTFKAAMAIKKFIENSEIKSMLCFFNKFPDENEFSKDILKDIFDKLCIQNDLDLSFDDNVLVLRTDYENAKEKLRKRLRNGEKILVFSTYQTIGAGQNLQYDIPKEVKTVCINDWKKSVKKDFDAIYLESPTNLYKRLNRYEKNSLVEYITQIEYLKENGTLSLHDANKYIKDAFKGYFYQEDIIYMSFTNMGDYKKYVRQKVMQAVGRICRTNSKSENIYIYYDDTLSNRIDSHISQNDLLNPEFYQLLRKINEKRENTTNEEQKFINQAETKSIEALNRIIRYVSDGRNGWVDNAIFEWQKIRRFVLAHPTMSEDEFIHTDNLYQPLYIKLNEKSNVVSFKKTEDFKDIEIYFDNKPGYDKVSFESARLNIFLSIGFIREMFKREGFATDFDPNDYIICPPVFTNIYKGALGEYVGKEIFSQMLNIELEEISNNELFELFDYKIPNTDIYIDFKNWNTKFIPSGTDIIPHIWEKLRKCGGKKALIINIASFGRFQMTSQCGCIYEIPRLYDVANNKFDKESIEEINKIINENI